MNEIIIVGGGPAGAAAGIELLRNGHDCHIVEKYAFPREKLCGGLLTEKSMQLVQYLCPNVPLQEFYELKTNDVELYSGSELITALKTEKTYYLTNRKLFDARLIEEFKSLGGKLSENESLTSIDTGNKNITTNKSEYTYTLLICADGARSKCLRLLTGKNQHDGFCLETDIEMEKAEKEPVRIYFGSLNEGYSWGFPKKGRLTIGTGWFVAKSKEYKEIFRKTLERTGFSDESTSNVKGAFIPTGKYMKKPWHGENILFVGDAAGLIDPITGEGIYFALESGRQAARAIIERNETKSQSHIGKAYKKRIKPIHIIMSQAGFYQKIVYREWFQRFFFKKIKGRTGFVRYYLDEIMSSYAVPYRGIATRYLLRKYFGKKK